MKITRKVTIEFKDGELLSPNDITNLRNVGSVMEPESTARSDRWVQADPPRYIEQPAYAAPALPDRNQNLLPPASNPQVTQSTALQGVIHRPVKATNARVDIYDRKDMTKTQAKTLEARAVTARPKAQLATRFPNPSSAQRTVNKRVNPPKQDSTKKSDKAERIKKWAVYATLYLKNFKWSKAVFKNVLFVVIIAGMSFSVYKVASKDTTVIDEVESVDEEYVGDLEVVEPDVDSTNPLLENTIEWPFNETPEPAAQGN